jgi:hypothetical protein
MSGGEIFFALISGIRAIGALSEGASTQDAANFNAQVLLNNAAAVRIAATEEGRRAKRLGIKRQGANRALDPDKLDLLEDSAIEEELNFQSIIHAGEVQAIGFENNAQLEIARGKSARKKAAFSAVGSLVGAAAFPAFNAFKGFNFGFLPSNNVGDPISLGSNVG